MKTLRLLLVASLLLPGLGRAGEQRVMLQYVPPSTILEVVWLYGSLTKRTVWVKLPVRLNHPVVLLTEVLPPSEVIALIRRTLLERYGIEIRDEGKDEAFVEYSKDIRYLSLQVYPITGAGTSEEDLKARITVSETGAQTNQK